MGLAVITGAATGVGYHLARIAAESGYDLVISDEDTLIYGAVSDCLHYGTDVLPVHARLSTARGVDALFAAIGDREVDIVCAALHLDDTAANGDAPHGVAANVVGCSHVIRGLLDRMGNDGPGHILVASPRSAASPVTGDSTLFLNRFADALRERLAAAEDPVTLTSLLLDPSAGALPETDTEAARLGWRALIAGRPMVAVHTALH